ncbi:leucine-rich repeat-containing protein 46 isoform X2 [Agelaius phoeniceus]
MAHTRSTGPLPTGTVRLDRENISCIGKTRGQESIHSLYLQQNQIEKMENLECFPNLRFLCLAGNRIQRVQNLQGLSQLSLLDLSHNLIQVLDTGGSRDPSRGVLDPIPTLLPQFPRLWGCSAALGGVWGAGILAPSSAPCAFPVPSWQRSCPAASGSWTWPGTSAPSRRDTGMGCWQRCPSSCSWIPSLCREARPRRRKEEAPAAARRRRRRRRSCSRFSGLPSRWTEVPGEGTGHAAGPGAGSAALSAAAVAPGRFPRGRAPGAGGAGAAAARPEPGGAPGPAAGAAGAPGAAAGPGAGRDSPAASPALSPGAPGATAATSAGIQRVQPAPR